MQLGEGTQDRSASHAATMNADTKFLKAAEYNPRTHPISAMQQKYPRASDDELAAFANHNRLASDDIDSIAFRASNWYDWRIFHAAVAKGGRPKNSELSPPRADCEWVAKLLEYEPECLNWNTATLTLFNRADLIVLCYALSQRDALEFSDLGLAVALYYFLKGTDEIADAFWLLDEMRLSPKYHTLALGMMMECITTHKKAGSIAQLIYLRALCLGAPKGPLFAAYGSIPHAMDIYDIGANGNPDELMDKYFPPQDVQSIYGYMRPYPPAALEHKGLLMQVAALHCKWGVLHALVKQGAKAELFMELESEPAYEFTKMRYTAGMSNSAIVANFILFRAAREHSILLVRYILNHPDAMPVSLDHSAMHVYDARFNYDMALKWIETCHTTNEESLRNAPLRAFRAMLDKTLSVSTFACIFTAVRPHMDENDLVELATYIEEGLMHISNDSWLFTKCAAIPEHMHGLAIVNRILNVGYFTYDASFELSLDVAAGRVDTYASTIGSLIVAAVERMDLNGLKECTKDMTASCVADRLPLIAGLCAAVRMDSIEVGEFLLRNTGLSLIYNEKLQLVVLCEAVKHQAGVQLAINLGDTDGKYYKPTRYDRACRYAICMSHFDQLIDILEHPRLAHGREELCEELITFAICEGSSDAFIRFFGYACKDVTGDALEILIKRCLSTAGHKDALLKYTHILDTAESHGFDMTTLYSMALNSLINGSSCTALEHFLERSWLDEAEMRTALLDALSSAFGLYSVRGRSISVLMSKLGDLTMEERMSLKLTSSTWKHAFPDWSSTDLVNAFRTLCAENAVREEFWMINVLKCLRLKRSERAVVGELIRNVKHRSTLAKLKHEETDFGKVCDEFADKHLKADNLQRACPICHEDFLVVTPTEAHVLATDTAVSPASRDDQNTHIPEIDDDELESDRSSDVSISVSSLAENEMVRQLWADSQALDPVVVKCPGGHIVHRECLFSWFMRSRTCPVCKAGLLSESA